MKYRRQAERMPWTLSAQCRIRSIMNLDSPYGLPGSISVFSSIGIRSGMPNRLAVDDRTNLDTPFSVAA